VKLGQCDLHAFQWFEKPGYIKIPIGNVPINAKLYIGLKKSLNHICFMWIDLNLILVKEFYSKILYEVWPPGPNTWQHILGIMEK